MFDRPGEGTMSGIHRSQDADETCRTKFFFLKQSLKPAMRDHFEQIVNGGGGRWIFPLCTSVLKFEHESVI